MPPTKESDFEKSDGVKKCPICKKSFGITHWRHHCHWCGDVVCDDCSKSQLPLPPTYPDAVRVCDLCKVEAAGQAARSAPRKLGTAAPSGDATATSTSTASCGPATTTSASGNYDEERAKRAAAVEARMKASNRTTATSSASFANDPEEAERQRQRELRQRIKDKDMAALAKEKKEKENRQIEEALASQQQKQQQQQSQQMSPQSEEFPASPPPSAAEFPADSPSPSLEPTPSTSSTFASGQGQTSNPMLEAAMRRQAANAAKGGGARTNAPAADPERAQLLARITQVLAAQKKEEPFALRSMDATKLRMYLRHLEE